MFNRSCKNCANKNICQFRDQEDYKCTNWIGEIELLTLRAPELNIKRALALKPADFEGGINSAATKLISDTANLALNTLAKYLNGHSAYARPIVIAAMRYIASERYSSMTEEEKSFADIVETGFQTIRFDFSSLNKN